MDHLRSMLILTLILGTGCAEKIDGEYRDVDQTVRFVFADDGTVVTNAFGSEVEGLYERRGDKLFIQGPRGTIRFEIDRDVLITPAGSRLYPRNHPLNNDAN